MIVTTTPSVEGRAIREYRGIVFGEVIAGVNFLRDIGAALRNVFGGRSKGYEEELTRARTESLVEMNQATGSCACPCAGSPPRPPAPCRGPSARRW